MVRCCSVFENQSCKMNVYYKCALTVVGISVIVLANLVVAQVTGGAQAPATPKPTNLTKIPGCEKAPKTDPLQCCNIPKLLTPETVGTCNDGKVIPMNVIECAYNNTGLLVNGNFDFDEAVEILKKSAKNPVWDKVIERQVDFCKKKNILKKNSNSTIDERIIKRMYPRVMDCIHNKLFLVS